MASISPSSIVPALLLALITAACGPSDEADRAQAGPIIGPFVVSDFYTPSGFMGDGAIPGRLTPAINEHCRTPRPAGAQGDCYRFIYKPGDVKWAGVFWVSPANNWGTSPGRDLIGPVDTGVADPDAPGSPNLRRYNYVRVSHSIFGMRADGQLEALPKEQVIRFWAGKLNGRTATPPQPYYDTGCSLSSLGAAPKCLDKNLVPPAPYFFDPAYKEIPITSEPRVYRLDLSRYSVTQLIAGFGFSLNADANADQNYAALVIYLDDIVWE
jgi:hypothetical protein